MFKSITLITVLFWAQFGYAAQGDIITIAGTASPSVNGTLANDVAIGQPEGIAIDALGNIYFSDYTNHQIKKIDRKTGVLSVVAGNGIAGYSGDGGQATQAQLNSPKGLVFSLSGDLYFSDEIAHVIRKINMQSGIINTFAGSGSRGFSGDGGQALLANLNYPSGLCFDIYSNLFFADTNNHRVRKVDASGIISTVAGTTLGFSGDGYSATMAKLYYPADVVVDAASNLFIADTYNNRIRKVDSLGIIHTVYGTGAVGSLGDGGNAAFAQLNKPLNIIFDSVGNLLIADSSNHKIRSVDPAGVIQTLAGDGSPGTGGDGSSALLAQLYYPSQLAVDSFDNVYTPVRSQKSIRMFGHVMEANKSVQVSFPLTDLYAVDTYLQGLHYTDASGNTETTLNFGMMPRPPISNTTGVFSANSTYDIPIFAANAATGALAAELVQVTYNPVKLDSMGVYASPPDRVEILFRAFDATTGYPVSNLTETDFDVTQDGLSLSVESQMFIEKVAKLQHLVQTVVMFDVSSSISAVNLSTMKQAAKNALIDPITGVLRLANQEIAIYKFDATVGMIQDFTASGAAISAAIDSIASQGITSTNLYGAVITGMSRLTTEATPTQLTEGDLVIITDGRDTSSYHTLTEAQQSVSNTLHIIGVVSPDLDKQAIQSLADDYLFVNNFIEVEHGLTEVSKYTDALANSFYKLYYNSPARNGIHDIGVSVKESVPYSYGITGQFDVADFTPSNPSANGLVDTAKTGCIATPSFTLVAWFLLFIFFLIRNKKRT